MKKLTIGILAHVDAGKTTCAEGLLYTSGALKQMGRVDHGDTVLDYDAQERQHGITIYAKETHFHWKNTEVYVIDTPGHVDFSSEMERTLQVLDLAVVLINGQDGVQSHTRTIQQCLKQYHVPAVIFVNKMDISHLTEAELMQDLHKEWGDSCIQWNTADRDENLAMLNEQMLDEYTETGSISEGEIQHAFYQRECFPVLFGSALKLDGIQGLADLINFLSLEREYPSSFGAVVYKVSEDEKGNRLTHLKITGGTLKAKQKINDTAKVDQIRSYSGTQFQLLLQAEAGDTIAVTGLRDFEPGMGLGFEKDRSAPLLKGFMNYELVLPEGSSELILADTCKKLAEEDPQLHISMDEHTGRIHVQIMGDMQKEILQKRIFEDSGIMVGFSEGRIIYQETIAAAVEGAGHFEPLRHYAEVHIRLEPLQRGEGIRVENECPMDMLSSAFQKNILSALERHHHRGVLTGSPLTDVRIVLTAGRGSLKHTSGGDFMQVSSRAVRQALMKADSILLEPYEAFELFVPSENLSRVLYDMEQRNADVKVEELSEENMRITGNGPVRTLMNYQRELTALSGGRGRISSSLTGYAPSHAQETLTEESGYDPEMDLRNPADSVFCAEGTGYTVSWREADSHMHIQEKNADSSSSLMMEKIRVRDEDLKTILIKAGGNNRNAEKLNAENRRKNTKEKEEKQEKKVQPEILPGLLMVDGYNMIFSWDSLSELAEESLAMARDRLIDDLYNYLPYSGEPIVLVFDGYKVRDNIGTEIQKGDLKIIYTKEGETADAYLEKSAYELKGRYRVTYATSDALIQNAVFSQGGSRLPARGLERELKRRNVIL